MRGIELIHRPLRLGRVSDAWHGHDSAIVATAVECVSESHEEVAPRDTADRVGTARQR